MTRSPSGLAFCRNVLREARPTPRQRPRCVVFDIDNTLVDTRHRTRAAANLYARRHPWLAELRDLPLQRIGYDGGETLRNATPHTGRRVVRSFQTFWEHFFWQPASLRHDRPIRRTVQLARQARAAGLEVFYLTGRIEALAPATIGQLRRLGLPDADEAHVLCKPSMDLRTAPFKQAVVARMQARHDIRWFMSDSPDDIQAVQQVLAPQRCVLVDFPVGARGIELHPATSVVRIRR